MPRKRKDLIIVESPTKAKTISRFLGNDFVIESSYGHIRDLPRSKMGVDIEHDFTPQYVIPRKNQKLVTKLRKLAATSPTIYFATDEDREGEAIAWHLLEAFQKNGKKEIANPEELTSKSKRIVFHEITEEAVKEALQNPRQINLSLVDAQQARRVLDRLVGYELSPFLWKKVAKGLSAGRVQSVALRLIVEREREIQAFKPAEYWTIEATFRKQSSAHETFSARLVKIDGKTIDKLGIPNADSATTIVTTLKAAKFHIADIKEKEAKKYPAPPFTTSALQQEANRKLGFSARQTMFIAQQLYEGIDLGNRGAEGLITYMRTDSVNLADKFLRESHDFISKTFGKQYALETPRRFKAKSKLAQEAHEAIRPTEVTYTPESIKQYLDPRQYKLYDLVWRRAVACQMPDAVLKGTTVDINDSNNAYTFRATGSTVTFDGFMKVYNSAHDILLPALASGEPLDAASIDPAQHFTEPPARYSEAGLVHALEERGIGRPSTYAPTIATIIGRGYVDREQKRLSPTEIGTLVNDVLVEHFPVVLDYTFTAHMEDDLDEVANGAKQWVPVIKEFYTPFKENLMNKMEAVSKKELTETATDQTCEKCGKPMVIKIGRFGKFLACTGYPECKNTKPLDRNGEIVEHTIEESKQTCEKCGKPMVVKHGRFGPFLACSGYPDCKNIKNIEQKTGVTCPQCGKGDIVAKRSKRGRTFYSCNKYPDCKFALWSKPTGEKCPQCGSLLVYAAGGKVRCSSKECKFEKTAEAAE
ncbi:MAG: type I DNA topoisomerase [Patescibacteria group bacterium]|nr:type I DNA topoisomerase [Patescibacteria group bacterium]MDD5715724.1 type I DNA topoisomerase [Patescibacteria group bacterium]